MNTNRHLTCNYLYCIHCWAAGVRVRLIEYPVGVMGSAKAMRRFKIRRAAAVRKHLKREHPEVLSNGRV